jgi:hypothetical protein
MALYLAMAVWVFSITASAVDMILEILSSSSLVAGKSISIFSSSDLFSLLLVPEFKYLVMSL